MVKIKQNVLFLCTGNSARSQMAEAFLKKYAGDDYDVFSAGLEPKGINPHTIRAMDEVGIDIRGQKSEATKDYMGKMFYKYVITVCGNADKNCPQALWAQSGVKLHWPFDDPAAATGSDEEIMMAFRQVRDQIDLKIKAWLEETEIGKV